MLSGRKLAPVTAVARGRNGAYPTGRYTAEAKAMAKRRQVRMLIRELRHLIDSGE